ncbi:hypothetical protein VTL71DRAFT_2636 [Oculimacula yallundae]|uniref:Uncharacterized protein n=1 Tax=Oculimacula yallundae TaxID=86028 RepID=A0ABR4C9W3_9HELO
MEIKISQQTIHQSINPSTRKNPNYREVSRTDTLRTVVGKTSRIPKARKQSFSPKRGYGTVSRLNIPPAYQKEVNITVPAWDSGTEKTSSIRLPNGAQCWCVPVSLSWFAEKTPLPVLWIHGYADNTVSTNTIIQHQISQQSHQLIVSTPAIRTTFILPSRQIKVKYLKSSDPNPEYETPPSLAFLSWNPETGLVFSIIISSASGVHKARLGIATEVESRPPAALHCTALRPQSRNPPGSSIRVQPARPEKRFLLKMRWPWRWGRGGSSEEGAVSR